MGLGDLVEAVNDSTTTTEDDGGTCTLCFAPSDTHVSLFTSWIGHALRGKRHLMESTFVYIFTGRFGATFGTVETV